MDELILKDYLFTGVSFSTFKFDKLTVLSCKYVNTKINILKKYYLKKIYFSLYNEKPKKDNSFQPEKYISYQTMKALNNSSILISNNPKEIRFYKHFKKNKNIVISKPFDLADLPLGASKMKACLFLNNKEEENLYNELINTFPNIKILYIEDLEKEDYVFDQIKVNILQDDSEIYFASPSIYSNYIINSAYSVNKIAIHL